MKRSQVIPVVLTFVIIGVGFGGCTRVQKGALIGGGVGAAVGGLWANNYGLLSAAEGAMVGGATGGLAGALIGDSLEDMDDNNAELDNLQRDLDARKAAIDKLAAENDELKRRIRELESPALQAVNPNDSNISVRETSRGVEYTILGNVLFDSGKSELKPEGKAILEKLGALLLENYSGHEMSIEGHTDDEPIKHSGWKSNWELGAARGLTVLHYLQDNFGFEGGEISATTFSMYRPAGEQRKENRRAVIVVLPKKA